MAGELEVARSAGQHPELHVSCINLPHGSQHTVLSPHTELLFRRRPKSCFFLVLARYQIRWHLMGELSTRMGLDNLPSDSWLCNLLMKRKSFVYWRGPSV